MKLPEIQIGNLTARIPIIQGGMSIRVSTSSLAAAVAECGGIGTIGGVGVPLEELKADIRKAKSMTKGIIAVNIMFAVRNFMETVKASIEAGVDMIATGAGFSRDIFKVGKDAGVPVISIVSSPEFGRLAERNGGVGLHFPPCHLLSYVKERFGTAEGTLPETEAAGARLLSLPLFPGMTDSDADYVCEAVREILAEGSTA